MPEPDRDKTDLGYGLSPGLISPSPPHGRDTRGCRHIHLNGRGEMTGGRPPVAPLSSELRHCTAYPEHRPEATWAQPLGPGRAVLTRGVSRRSGSVACIHADASPTEVLACPSCTATHCASNWFTQPLRRFLLTNGFSGTIHRRPICRRGLPSKPWPILCRRRRSRRCSTGCTRKRKIRCRGCAKGMVISTGR